jgi:large subunit ribosomal protein L21
MYAIIADSGRQYRVQEGQELEIDYRDAATTGDKLEFGRVLAVSQDDGLQIGTPELPGARVIAEVLGIEQGKKIFVQKLRRRKTFRRRTGHRQLYTRIRIEKIEIA